LLDELRDLEAVFFEPEDRFEEDDRLADERFAPPLEEERWRFVAFDCERPDEERFFPADFPFFGILTPSRRASDSPIAIACLGFFALPPPCLYLCICSSTYSPA
jgi:hypothetical protein